MKKQIIIRIIFIALLLVLGIFLYISGKEHTIFIDNKDITLKDIVYKANNDYKVWIDNKELKTIRKGERGLIKVTGTNHKIMVEKIVDEVLTGEQYEKRFKLKTNEKNVIINIPAMINNADIWIKKQADI